MTFNKSFNYKKDNNSSFRFRSLLIYVFISMSVYAADINGWIPSKYISQFLLSSKHSINSKIIESTESWYTLQEWLVSWNNLHKKNIELTKTINLNKDWQIEALRLRIENKNLQKLLDFKKISKSSLLKTLGFGRLISYGTRQYPFSAVLSLSDTEKLIKVNSVLLQSASLAGRVIESGKGWVRVLHIIDSSSHIPVETQRSRDRAILTGNNSPKPYLEFLSDFHQIDVGDIVMTSGHGGIFPAGIPIGAVQKDSNGQFQINLFAPYHSIGWLKIIPAVKGGEIDY